MSAEEIRHRSFATGFRGFDQAEVRAYLDRIADELDAAERTERELREEVRRARDRALHPRLDEHELTAALGDEAVRILQSAHAAAADTKGKAEENAARILAEAHEQAERIRRSADTVLGERTTEAEAAAEGIRAAADTAAAELLGRARRQAESALSEARAAAETMATDAEHLKSRVLGELAQRRRVMHAQVEQLAAGRESILRAVQTVRGFLDQVVGSLDSAEFDAKRAAAEALQRALAETDDDVEQLERSVGPALTAPLAVLSTVASDLGESVDALRQRGALPASPAAPEAEGAPAEAALVASSEPAVPADASPVEASPVEASPVEAGPGEAGPVVSAPAGSAAAVAASTGSVATPSPTLRISTAAATSAATSSAAPSASPPVSAAPSRPPVVIVDSRVSEPVSPDAPAEREVPTRRVSRRFLRRSVEGAPPAAEAVEEGVRLLPPEGQDARPEEEVVEPASDEDASPTAPAEEATPTESTARVDELFARLRAQREATRAKAEAALLAAEDASPGTAPSGGAVEGPGAGAPDAMPETAPEPEDEMAPIPAPSDGADEDAVTADDESVEGRIIEARNRALAPVHERLARRLKRTLQDDHNAILDRVRGEARARTGATLPDAADHEAGYASAVMWLVEEAFGAGRSFAAEFFNGATAGTGSDSGSNGSTSDAGQVAESLAAELVRQLRGRLEEAFGRDADESELAEATNAAFRAWKGERVDSLAMDYALAAFEAGVLKAVTPGTGLRWIVDDDGPCPDCDDNGLAGATAAGESFPTGQSHPPAHPGCRCLLAPATA